jgi:hypothetical protein
MSTCEKCQVETKPYIIIEVREKHAKVLRRFFVSDSGSITLEIDEAAKFPLRYEWAANTLIAFWNKGNRVYEYGRVTVYPDSNRDYCEDYEDIL